MELPDTEETAVQAKNDPFARLEKGVEDKQRGREGAERIAELREDSAAKYMDDYTMNKALRRQLRHVPCPAVQGLAVTPVQAYDSALLHPRTGGTDLSMHSHIGSWHSGKCVRCASN